MTRGMSDRDPDLELVLALQRGEDAALDALIERHQHAIFGFVYRHVFNEADARELTQEVFVRAYFGIKKFRPTAKFATWLYRIALNLCRDHVRSRRVRQASVTGSLSAETPEGRTWDSEIASATPDPAEAALMDEKLAALERGLASLPHRLRTALVMTTLQERTHKECAELLQTTPKGVEKRVYRARLLLGKWMTEAGFIFLVAIWLR